MRSSKLLQMFVILGVSLFSFQILLPQTVNSEPVPFIGAAGLAGAPAAIQINARAESSTGGVGSVPISVKPGIPLNTPRTRHTATLLHNGKILLIGGSKGPDDFILDQELFDPINGTTSLIAPLHTPRHDHSATLLPDGRVLVVGGYNLPLQWLGNAEIYDPTSNTWTVVPPLYTHGSSHTATVMKDGRVLVVGGCIGDHICTEKVEIFDPKTNMWVDALALKDQRAGQIAQLLSNGRVLVAGGNTAFNQIPSDGTAVLYDPTTNTWSETGPMTYPRVLSEAVMLRNGEVLVAGGIVIGSDPPASSNAVEIYNPRTNTWRTAPSLSKARFGFILSTTSNGRVIAIGGSRDWDWFWTQDSLVHEIEYFEPSARQWSVIANLPEPSAFGAGVRLRDERLWISGGDVANQVMDKTWFIKLPPVQREIPVP